VGLQPLQLLRDHVSLDLPMGQDPRIQGYMLGSEHGYLHREVSGYARADLVAGCSAEILLPLRSCQVAVGNAAGDVF
jgi:hypothetical protein